MKPIQVKTFITEVYEQIIYVFGWFLVNLLSNAENKKWNSLLYSAVPFFIFHS